MTCSVSQVQSLWLRVIGFSLSSISGSGVLCSCLNPQEGLGVSSVPFISGCRKKYVAGEM